MTYKQNTYDDDDLRDVLARHEEFDAQCETIMATARGEISALRNKQKVLRKEAVDDLSIPRGVLGPLLKRRKLDRQIAKLEAGVDEDLIEVYQDAVGQFSFLAPADAEQADEPKAKPKKKGKTVKEAAAESDQALKESIAATEQADGDKILESAVH